MAACHVILLDSLRLAYTACSGPLAEAELEAAGSIQSVMTFLSMHPHPGRLLTALVHKVGEVKRQVMRSTLNTIQVGIRK